MLNSIGCRKITCATCPTCPMDFVFVDFNNKDYEFIKDLDPLSLVLVLKTKFEEFYCGEIELEWPLVNKISDNHISRAYPC